MSELDFFAGTGAAIEMPPKGSPVFGLYESHNTKAAAKLISVNDLAEMAENPTVTARGSLIKAIAQHDGSGKTAQHAIDANFAFFAQDHDDDNKTKQEIKALYDSLGVPYLAFTSSSHQQEINKNNKPIKRANKWKVIIPLASALGADEFEWISKGIAHSIGTVDSVQARLTQIVYIPTKLDEGAAYEVINELGDEYEWLTPYDGSVFMQRAAEGWQALQAEEREKENQAPTRTRPSSTSSSHDAGIIEKIIHSGSIASTITARGYKRKRGGYLAPNSSSGTAGIRLLERDGKEVLYSHHSAASDPLSAENNGGHALDRADVIRVLDFDGDESAMIAHYAKELDPDGQKQRQREHMAEQDQAKALAMLESQAATLNTQAPSNVDLNKPHGIVGDICHLMSLKARRDIPELYPAAAMQLVSLVGHKRQSVLTDRLSISSLTIAESAVGKDNPQGTLSSIAQALKMTRHIMGGIGSFKEMITNMIDGDGVTVYSSDEVHSIFQSISSKNAPNYEQKIEAEILKMSTNELYLFRGMEKRENLARLTKKLEEDDQEVAKAVAQLEAAEASKDPAKIKEATDEKRKRTNIIAKTRRHIDYITNGWPFPFFGFMGFSTPKNMEAITANPDNIASGMLGRMLITRTGNYIPKVKRELDKGAIQFQEIEVIEKLGAIQDLRDEPLEITAEASELLGKYADYYEADEQRLHNTMGAVWRRAYEQVVKVASVMALGNKYISVEDVEYANAYVLNSICDLENIIIQVAATANGASAETVFKAARNTLLKDCKGSRGRTKYEITKFITRNEQWKAMQEADASRDRVQELIDHLIKAGALEAVQSPRSIRYRTINPQ